MDGDLEKEEVGGSRSQIICCWYVAACSIARDHDLLIVPSVKYHLPLPGETEWRTEEYVETTRAILDVYQSSTGNSPMPREDFSPTLAGSDA